MVLRRHLCRGATRWKKVLDGSDLHAADDIRTHSAVNSNCSVQ